MGSMKEMAVEYREAAAKLSLYIKLHAKEMPAYKVLEYRKALQEVREAARVLEHYYDLPRSDRYQW